MPIQLTVDMGAKIITYDVSGETTTEDWRNATEQAFSQVKGNPSWNVLIDVRNHKTVASTQFLWELASRFPSSGKAGGKWAIVVSRVVSEGISNMVSTLVSDSGIRVKAFRDRDEAMKWIEAE